ncbi:MAG: hypothetical protein JKY03_01060 [Aureispira sp.]|nr:hypothetical protein [Aureispira sp.]
MQPKIKELIYSKEAFAGVECLQREGQFYYHLCILKKEKNSAKIVLQQENISSLSELKEILKEDLPIFLGINIKGILNRVLDYVPSSKEDALTTVFPSAKEEDFYLQQVETNQKALISIVRKDSVLELLKDFEAAELWVVNAFVGPFWVEEILPILPAYVQTVQIEQQVLTIENQHITGLSKSVETSQDSFSIGGDRVSESLSLALSMAFLAITQPTIQGVEADFIAQQQINFYYKRLFHYTTLVALAFFFVALFTNYLLFDYYDSEQKGLKVEVSQQQSLLNQRDNLAKKYKAKKSLLGDQLHLGQSKSSYYADQLAATLPSSLQLTKLVLFPSIKEEGYSSEETLPRYDNQTILVEGQCQASVFYNNWKRSLEELDWVASIHNLSYQNNKNGQGIFKLKITLKNE